MNNTAFAVTLAALGVCIVDRWIKYRKESARIEGMPGLRVLFGLSSYVLPACVSQNLMCVEPTPRAIGHMLPGIPYIATGPKFAWSTKYKSQPAGFCEAYQTSDLKDPVFEKYGAGIYGAISIFPTEGGFCVSDLEALKARHCFIY